MIIPFTPSSAKIFAGIALVATGLTLAAAAGMAIQTMRLDGEQRAHTQTKERYSAAQLVAKVRQDASDREALHLNTRIAENNNVISELAARDARAAVDRFARANPVRLRCEAAQSVGGGAPASGLPRDPGPVPDPAGSPEMVAIARTELDQLAGAAMQGAVQTLFLRELVDKGIGIPLSRLSDPAAQPTFGGEP